MPSTFEVFPGISALSDRFSAILLDAYGVFWGSNDFGVLPGSKEAMEKLVSSGKIVGILSNSTQLSAKEIAKLHSHGLILGKHFHFLLTSGEVARNLFLSKKLPFPTPRRRFWLFGESSSSSTHEAIFQGSDYSAVADIDEADFIYIPIPRIHGEDQLNPEAFQGEIEKLSAKKLPMVCPNPDQFAHEGKSLRAVVRQGSIAKLYEEMGGSVFYIGKPYPQAYAAAMAYFQEQGIEEVGQVLMVGDTPETDIRGARSFGISSALVLRTGIMAGRIDHNGLEKAFQQLAPGDIPHYFIQRL